MTGGLELVSVKRVGDGTTRCRRCRQGIERGRRVALVLGLGDVCLRCWLASRERREGADDALVK